MKKNLSLPIFILAFTLNVALSQNLVVNYSFETFSACPAGVTNTSDELLNATGWQNARPTADYLNACYGSSLSPGTAGVPCNFAGYQPPSTGNAYGGFYAFTTLPTDNREYIYGQLSSPLVPGQTYNVSMQVNLASKSKRACNNIGIYFTTNGTYSFTNNIAIPNAGDVYTSSIISDTTNWTVVSGSFVASSAAQYFIIGNLFNDAASSQVAVSSPYIFTDGAYYYVDDISVTPNALPVEIISFNAWPEKDEQSVKLEWTTASEHNNALYTIERSLNGHDFYAINSVKGNGNSESESYYFYTDTSGVNNGIGSVIYYRLKQEDYNGYSQYSKTISISASLMAEKLQCFSKGDFLYFSASAKQAVIAFVFISDVSGKRLQVSSLPLCKGKNELPLNISSLSNGLYYLSVLAGDEYCISGFYK